MKKNIILTVILTAALCSSCSMLLSDLKNAAAKKLCTVELYAGPRGTFSGKQYTTLTVVSDTIIDLNDYLPEVPEEEQNRWEFSGWLDEKGNPAATVCITDNCSFIAQYIKLCTVTFMDGTEEIQTLTGIKQNTKINEPDPRPKDGWEFVGWFTQEGNQWIFDTDNIINDTTLYARWTQVMHTITFEPGEHGKFEETKVKFPEGAILDFSKIPVDVQAQDGWEFLCWQTEDDEGNPVQVPDGAYEITKDATLTAIWAQDKFSITFAAGTQGYFGTSNAKKTTTEITVDKDKPINLLDPEYIPEQYTGWVFTGWELDGQPVKNPESYSITKNIKLVAAYRRLDLQLLVNNKPATVYELGKKEKITVAFEFKNRPDEENQNFLTDEKGIIWEITSGTQSAISSEISSNKYNNILTGNTPVTTPVSVSVTINGITSSPLAVTVGDYRTLETPANLDTVLNEMQTDGDDTIKIKGDDFFSETYTFEDLCHAVDTAVTGTQEKIVLDLSETDNITLPEWSSNTSIKEIILPDTMTEISTGAFYGFESLETITLPQGLTTIGASVFMGCEQLTTIDIPATVTSIGDFAFSDLKNLKTIIYRGNPNNCTLGTTYGITSVFPDIKRYSSYSIYVPDVQAVTNPLWLQYKDRLKNISELP